MKRVKFNLHWYWDAIVYHLGFSTLPPASKSFQRMMARAGYREVK